MKDIGNRVAIYCRVSTDGQSVDLQVNDLREYADRRGLQIIEQYLDVGVSGSKESRPALNKLMQMHASGSSTSCSSGRSTASAGHSSIW
jgi:DNA invertase Pin-like site-specific DNA recombinase